MLGKLTLISFAILGIGAICSLALPYNKVNQEGKRLIKLSEEEPAKWLTQEEVFEVIRKQAHFVDITDHQSRPLKTASVRAFPEKAQYQSIVEPIILSLSIARMESFIQSFSEFYNRYYNVASGRDSSEWLQSQAQAVFEASSYTASEVTIQAFGHSWLQSSVIARIEGADPLLKDEIVVLGAHQDSLNLLNPAGGKAPGADDDASGSVVLLETFRALLTSGFVPKRTIEFQWYAAEEVGLRGSEDIAESYYNADKNVIAMGQFDVVGYTTANSNKDIGIVTDYTDASLNSFLRIVVDEYCTSNWKDLTCGYGCSDHASWDSFGFAAAFPVEFDFSPHMHTIRDTIDTVDFEYLLEFGKLAIGFTVELAEPL